MTANRFAILLLTAAPALAAGHTPLTWWTAGALHKIRPSDQAPQPAPKAAYLKAARNEFEPFQVALRADANDTDGIDVEISDFRGAAGSRIPADNVTVYAEQFIDIAKATPSGGGTGPWPDALVPRTDRYAHERRNAFPLILRREYTQPLWFEVYVPETAVPGSYQARATFSRRGQAEFSIPIHLAVWAFSLPSTASFKTTFGFNGVTALKQHRGSYTSDADLYAITSLYAKAALLHRISIHGGSQTPPKFTCDGHRVSIDWHSYDAEVGPQLDGTAFSRNDPLAGARATTVEVRAPASFESAGCEEAYYSAWVKHFQQKGWDSRLFVYLWDEPQAGDAAKVARRGEAVLRGDPNLETLVTAPFSSRFDGFVRIWAPVVNCLESRPGFADYCSGQPPLSVYRSPEQHGKSLWFYLSCASHGCNGPGGPYFIGWPSYVIDAPALASRVMPWIAWKFAIQGELYYNMDEAYAYDKDPWTNLRMSGGNGDGTLFYPGRTSRIGGHTDIPVESIRLKLIREGMEDYEYLALAAKLGGSALADQFAARIVTEPYSWESEPEKFLAVRSELGDVLDRLSRSAGNRALGGVHGRGAGFSLRGTLVPPPACGKCADIRAEARRRLKPAPQVTVVQSVVAQRSLPSRARKQAGDLRAIAARYAASHEQARRFLPSRAREQAEDTRTIAARYAASHEQAQRPLPSCAREQAEDTRTIAARYAASHEQARSILPSRARAGDLRTIAERREREERSLTVAARYVALYEQAERSLTVAAFTDGSTSGMAGISPFPAGPYPAWRVAATYAIHAQQAQQRD